MIESREFPILEFDENKEALINPVMLRDHYGMFPERLVITFFKDIINQLLEEEKIKYYQTLAGENDLVVYKFCDSDTLIFHGVVGGAATGGFLDELIGLGVNKIMFCGGGGVLRNDITVGKLLVVDGAIRDDGMSYHYAAPSRIIKTDEEAKKTICSYLESINADYLVGLTWTTDAFFRETKEKIQLRKAEGALVVEMEQAGCIAVADFRNVKYGAVIYCGDDVSMDEWDRRDWVNRKDIRYSLTMMCYEIVRTF